MNSDCCSSCCCEQEKKENRVAECPVCREEGKLVSTSVVSTMLKREFRDKLGKGEYYLCLEQDCTVAYFTGSGETIIKTDEIKKPIWFKTGAEPQIACYCNDISYSQVEKAVKEQGYTSWEKIVRQYREKAICACDKLNPAGECCSENFYRIVNETLKSIGREPLPKELCSCS